MDAQTVDDDVLPRTLEIIERICHRQATAESRFIEDLHLDSIDLVGLIAEMEDEFHVIVNETQVRTFQTVADAVACFRALRGAPEES